MLIQFNVGNFLSFKDEISISMLAGFDKSHESSLLTYEFKDKKQRLLPSAAIYGSNAAGKSNIITALSTALLVLKESNTRQIDDKISRIIPFLFDKAKKNEPSTFGFIFTASGIKYEYSFVADKDRIYEESLYFYKTAKASMVFERKNTNEYRFPQASERRYREYESKNTDNKLFLATATIWNCEETKIPYQWLSEKIDFYDMFNPSYVIEKYFSKDADNSLKKFVTSFLHEADINIDNYSLKISDMQEESFSVNSRVNEPLSAHRQKVEIRTTHSVLSNGIKEIFEIPFAYESDGTKNLFFFAPIINEALKQGKTILVDELDRSLHPLLVKFIVELFNDKNKNPNGAQLIFTSHDMELLDLKLFRRDQIYLVEKDFNTGISSIYSLDEFSPRKTENIKNSYLEGRFGAIPFIGGKTSWDD